MALRPFHVLELCAGAGGLGLGIKLAVPGARGVAYVEREAAAAAKLVHRMETGDLAPAPVWSDLATFDARPWRGRVHCVASGDPCQPNSVAGKRGGAGDDRFLADQVLRIVDECRPDRLFRENVPGNADGQLAALVPALEGMADREDGAGRLYARQWRPGEGAADVGGDGGSLGDAERAEWRPRAGQCEGAGAIGLSARREQGSDRPTASGEELGYAGGQRSPSGIPTQAGGNGQRSMPAISDDAGSRFFPIVCPGPGDTRWPGILAVAPELEPAICRVAHAMADRVDRLRLLGNGVDPVAAAYAWICLDALHREAAGIRDGAGIAAVSAAA